MGISNCILIFKSQYAAKIEEVTKEFTFPNKENERTLDCTRKTFSLASRVLFCVP